MRLSKSIIQKLTYQKKAPQRDFRRDDALPGFGVRVFPSGKKTYCLRYAFHGRDRMITVGDCAVWELEQARTEARQMLVGLARGIDPLLDKERQRKAYTVEQLAETYLEDYAKPHKRSWKSDESKIRCHILPSLGKRSLESITPKDVIDWHKSVTASSGPYQANRCLEIFRCMINLAIQWRYYEGVNPAKGIKRNVECKRDRWANEDEAGRLLRAIDQIESLSVRQALRFYFFTGLRKSTVLGAKWSWVNFETKTLHVPAAKNKSGRDLCLPLSSAAIDLLMEIPRLRDNEYIFPGNIPGRPLANIDHAWQAIREKAGVPDLRIHDLRHTVGSWLTQHEKSLPLTGAVLDQSNASVTEGYAHFAQDHLRAALERHSERVIAAKRNPQNDQSDK